MRKRDASALTCATGTRSASATSARLWSTVIKRGAALAREPHERRVDVDDPGLFDQLDLHEGRLLQLHQDVEAATSARAPLGVGGIGDRLQLAEHTLVHQQACPR